MGSSTYFLSISRDSDGEPLALAYGDLAEVTYLAKRQIKELTGSSDSVSVRLVETEAIGQLDEDSEPTDVKRTVTSFTGEGDDAAALLKRKLARERGANGGQQIVPAQPGEDQSGPLVAEQPA